MSRLKGPRRAHSQRKHTQSQSRPQKRRILQPILAAEETADKRAPSNTLLGV